MKKIAVMFAAVAAMCASAVAAEYSLADVGVADKSASIVLGEWHGDYAKCKALADSENIPLIAYYGKEGCSRCRALTENLISDTFRNWRKGKRLILLYMKQGENGNGYSDSSSAKGWIKSFQSEGGFPYFLYYWKKPDGSVVSEGYGKSARNIKPTQMVARAVALFGDALTGGGSTPDAPSKPDPVTPSEPDAPSEPVITDPFVGNFTYTAVVKSGSGDNSDIEGVLYLKAAKAKKSRSKLTGTFQSITGKRYTVKSQYVTVNGKHVETTLEIKKYANMKVSLAAEKITGGNLEQFVIGGTVSKGVMSFGPIQGMKLSSDYSVISEVPTTESFVASRKKWDFGKNPTLKYVARDGGYVLTGLNDTAKPNVRMVRVTYDASTGIFKGTCKVLAYRQKPGRKPTLKKVSGKIYGFVINGAGVGLMTASGGIAEIVVE